MRNFLLFWVMGSPSLDSLFLFLSMLAFIMTKIRFKSRIVISSHIIPAQSELLYLKNFLWYNGSYCLFFLVSYKLRASYLMWNHSYRRQTSDYKKRKSSIDAMLCIVSWRINRFCSLFSHVIGEGDWRLWGGMLHRIMGRSKFCGT